MHDHHLLHAGPLLRCDAVHSGAPAVGVGRPPLGGSAEGIVADILTGATVVGICGEVIGVLAEVYLDNQTGRSQWAAVTVGGHRRVVSLEEARLDGTTMWVPVTAEQVATAPHRDPATALTAQDEHDLHRHYALTDQNRSGRPFVVSVAHQPARLRGAETGDRRPQRTPLRRRVNRTGGDVQNRSPSTLGGLGVCPPAVVRC